MRIAIVDDLSADAEKLREFICRWAQEQGIFLVPAPVVFESGEALLAGFALDSFDVIFLDIYMSGMTGMEAAKKSGSRIMPASSSLRQPPENLLWIAMMWRQHFTWLSPILMKSWHRP